MRLLTLDASVVLKWYSAAEETHLDKALALLSGYQTGAYRVVAPYLLELEMMNVVSRRWGWTGARLEAMAVTVRELRFDLEVPDRAQVARWADRGLSAYDAAYVAVAQEHGATLITDDQGIVRIAEGIAIALADVT